MDENQRQDRVDELRWLRIQDSKDNLLMRLGRPATWQEICVDMELDPEEYFRLEKQRGVSTEIQERIDYDAISAAMRQYEREYNAVIPGERWIVLVLDGNNFTALTNTHFVKPFDMRFLSLMILSTEKLMSSYDAIYAYTGSDEMSIVLPPSYSQHNRRVEKLVSLSAAEASAHFSLGCAMPISFDCRVLAFPDAETVIEYLLLKQSIVNRNALTTALYWELRASGFSAHQATEKLRYLSYPEKEALLREHGSEYQEITRAYRKGVGMAWIEYSKPGYNPITKETTVALRRKIEANHDLPDGHEYKLWLHDYLEQGSM